jgi:hypothetical protein
MPKDCSPASTRQPDRGRPATIPPGRSALGSATPIGRADHVSAVSGAFPNAPARAGRDNPRVGRTAPAANALWPDRRRNVHRRLGWPS